MGRGRTRRAPAHGQVGVTYDDTAVSPNPSGYFALALACVATLVTRAQGPTVFINEFHYDNAGADTGEFVEIAGPAGTSLVGYSVVLYNGSGGASYSTVALTGAIPNQQNGFGALAFAYAVNGIQNGAPDGIVLVGPAGVIQFLSYEGVFTATNGPANGLTSTDIGICRGARSPPGARSIWSAPAPHTPTSPGPRRRARRLPGRSTVGRSSAARLRRPRSRSATRRSPRVIAAPRTWSSRCRSRLQPPRAACPSPWPRPTARPRRARTTWRSASRSVFRRAHPTRRLRST